MSSIVDRIISASVTENLPPIWLLAQIIFPGFNTTLILLQPFMLCLHQANFCIIYCVGIIDLFTLILRIEFVLPISYKAFGLFAISPSPPSRDRESNSSNNWSFPLQIEWVTN